MLDYTITDARYAKNMKAIQTPGPGMWKSVAALILTTEIAPNARWSDREQAYIVSKAQANRFIDAIEVQRQRECKVICPSR